MTTTIAWSISFFSTAAFIALWFWAVRKELKIKQNMVESAKTQLVASKKWRLKARDATEEKKAQAILDRSMNIYLQSMELYRKVLHKPWNYLPGLLMGFHSTEKEGGL